MVMEWSWNGHGMDMDMDMDIPYTIFSTNSVRDGHGMGIPYTICTKDRFNRPISFKHETICTTDKRGYPITIWL